MLTAGVSCAGRGRPSALSAGRTRGRLAKVRACRRDRVTVPADCGVSLTVGPRSTARTDRVSGPTARTDRVSGPTARTNRVSGPTARTNRVSGPTARTDRVSGPTARTDGQCETDRSSDQGLNRDRPGFYGSTGPTPYYARHPTFYWVVWFADCEF